MRIFRLLFASLLLLLTPFFLFSEEDETLSEAEIETQEEETRARYKAIFFFKDLLDDRYPFRIDFGAEPHRHGSMIFGAAYYDWSDTFSQSIRGEYDHYTTSVNSRDNLTSDETRSVTVITFPVVLSFGNESVYSRSLFNQINIGFYYKYNLLKANQNGFIYNNDTFGSCLMTSNGTQSYHLFGPAASYILNLPLHKYISLTCETFFVPAYFMTLSTDYNINYYTGSDTYTDSYKIDSNSFSYPFIKQTVALDFFRYIRIKAQLSYQHINLRTTLSSDISNTRYSMHTLTLRYGGEILNPSKTRKKSSHLWGGLYYEMTWENQYYKELVDRDYTGKFVICFGT
ncbi:hypothetical protein [Treponema sp.]|uniref:hypothetical protein n=1 Tax=Treponema sp. TaxID=166 RepID=UPI00388F2B83